MIEMVWIGARACPKIICDSCGEEITDVKTAGVVFPNSMDDSQRTSAAYVHKNFVKGNCMSQAEERICANGGSPGWAELGQMLADLISNAGMTATDVRKRLK